VSTLWLAKASHRNRGKTCKVPNMRRISHNPLRHSTGAARHSTQPSSEHLSDITRKRSPSKSNAAQRICEVDECVESRSWMLPERCSPNHSVTKCPSRLTWGTTSLRNCAYPRPNPRDIMSRWLLSSRALPPAKYH
jgi:hypothetical protein